MKPDGSTTFVASCERDDCGWRYSTKTEQERAARLRYHRLLVHADPHAVQGPAF